MEEQRNLRLLEYFDGKPEEFSIYQCLESKILVKEEELDDKLMGWVEEAYWFSAGKW